MLAEHACFSCWIFVLRLLRFELDRRRSCINCWCIAQVMSSWYEYFFFIADSFMEAFFFVFLLFSFYVRWTLLLYLPRKCGCKWKWNDCDSVHNKKRQNESNEKKNAAWTCLHAHTGKAREREKRKRSKAMLVWPMTMISMIYFWIDSLTEKNIPYFFLLNRSKTKSKKLQQQQKFNRPNKLALKI